MQVQPAAFLRTTLALGLNQLDVLDSDRYHSIWLPDHMMSFRPDAIWTPEFTDLATTSPPRRRCYMYLRRSPRHFDSLSDRNPRRRSLRLSKCLVHTDMLSSQADS